MSTMQTLHLAAMGATFAVWAFFMFSMLFRLSRRSSAKTAQKGGGFGAWIGHSLSSFGEAATSEEDRPLRLRILWAGMILMILIALTPIVGRLAG